jgi:hypothetical protein
MKEKQRDRSDRKMRNKTEELLDDLKEGRKLHLKGEVLDRTT